jgi:hypothetical protein
MSDLTDEAKAEIAEAIRIVREDRFEQYVRGHVSKSSVPSTTPTPTTTPTPIPTPTTTPTPIPTPTTTPPPAKPDPVEPPAQKKRGIWWGEDSDG